MRLLWLLSMVFLNLFGYRSTSPIYAWLSVPIMTNNMLVQSHYKPTAQAHSVRFQGILHWAV